MKPPGNPELAQRVAEAGAAAMRKSSAKNGRPVTCRGAGCFACCAEPVECSEGEARYIVDSLTDEQKTEVAARVSAWLAKVQRSGLLRLEKPHVMDWRRVQAWCPLLKDGLCSVYEKRPVSCRLHMAIGNPDDCATEARARQKYAVSPEVNTRALQAECDGESGLYVFDNLGVWLAELLLGMPVESAARRGIDVEIKDP